MMPINTKKIGLFLALAFGISWIMTAIILAAGVKAGTMTFMASVAVFVMSGPAVAAVVVQKLIYKEDLSNIGLRWSGVNWKAMLLYPIFVASFVFGTLGFGYLLGNVMGFEAFGTVAITAEGMLANVAETMSADQLEAAKKQLEIGPWAILLLTLGMALIAGLTVNGLAALGEELGWRGLLEKELRPLGFWKANIVNGIFWGLWHAPIIVAIGFNYPENPWLGVGMMCLFTTSAGFVHAYLRLKTGTVFSAAALHGAINASAGIIPFMVQDSTSFFSHPVGFTAIFGFLLVTVIIYLFDRETIDKNIETYTAKV